MVLLPGLQEEEGGRVTEWGGWGGPVKGRHGGGELFTRGGVRRQHIIDTVVVQEGTGQTLPGNTQTPCPPGTLVQHDAYEGPLPGWQAVHADP
jgi:hypothetical protein